jgi:hypothetical protein
VKRLKNSEELSRMRKELKYAIEEIEKEIGLPERFENQSGRRRRRKGKRRRGVEMSLRKMLT